jgi:hypothetical protein
MNRLFAVALASAAVLIGCGDTKSAGGTGSDFPQPLARLLDTNLQPISARVWRLWRVQGDSAEAVQQILDSNGFRVPSSGLWVVEAWSDSVKSGPLGGLSKSRFTDTNNSCSRALTYLSGSGTALVGVLPCADLPAPSLSTPSRLTKPLGVGVFGSTDAIQRVSKVPGPPVAAFRFQIFQILWDSVKHPDTAQSVTGTDSVLLRYWGYRISSLPGAVDVSLASGDWMFKGWVAQLDSTGMANWSKPPVSTSWANKAVLLACRDSVGSDGYCEARPTASSPQGEADVFFVVHAP